MKPASARAHQREGEIDLFLGFQCRLQSLEFFRDEVGRQQARGEEIMAEIARLRPTGDVLRDARVRAGWEEQLEDAFEVYGTALSRLWWELEQ